MVTLKVTEAKTVTEKILGQLLYNKPVNLLLKTRFGIHTFGMRFPIDIVILDSNNRVVAIRENLIPNRIFAWNPKYNVALELAAGTIKRFSITNGVVVQLATQRSKLRNYN